MGLCLLAAAAVAAQERPLPGDAAVELDRPGLVVGNERPPEREARDPARGLAADQDPQPLGCLLEPLSGKAHAAPSLPTPAGVEPRACFPCLGCDRGKAIAG